MRIHGGVWVWSGLFLGLASAPALACDLALPRPFAITANPADDVPPSTPRVAIDDLGRGTGCGMQGACSRAFVRLQLSASDDTSPAENIGYLVEAEGRAEQPYGAGHPVVRASDGTLLIVMRKEDDGGELRLNLLVYAIDQAGNMSGTPARLEVRDDSGCTLIGGRIEAGIWSALLLAIMLFRNGRLAKARSAR